MVHVALDGLPSLAQKISQADEAGHPQDAAAIGEQRELVRLQVAHPRRVGRQMPHARNEITERQPPVAHALRTTRAPCRRALRVIRRYLP